jgi:predicted DNA-binding protein (MmcQ/YjbR family)
LNVEDFRHYCLTKPGTSEDLPFDDVTLTFKVGSKIFAITGLDNEVFEVNLKCDPDLAIQLREKYEGVRPGFHMNKKHWNTVNFESAISDTDLLKMVDHSYDLVFQGLPKKIRQEILDEG